MLVQARVGAHTHNSCATNTEAPSGGEWFYPAMGPAQPRGCCCCTCGRLCSEYPGDPQQAHALAHARTHARARTLAHARTQRHATQRNAMQGHGTARHGAARTLKRERTLLVAPHRIVPYVHGGVVCCAMQHAHNVHLACMQ